MQDIERFIVPAFSEYYIFLFALVLSMFYVKTASRLKLIKYVFYLYIKISSNTQNQSFISSKRLHPIITIIARFYNKNKTGLISEKFNEFCYN